jgi:hypothetical protein
MIKIKTSHLAVAGFLCILLLNGENLRNVSARTEAVKTRKDSHKEHINLEQERGRNALDLSKIALDRYRQNCIFVVDFTTKKEAYFQPGSAVSVSIADRVCSRMDPVRVQNVLN